MISLDQKKKKYFIINSSHVKERWQKRKKIRRKRSRGGGIKKKKRHKIEKQNKSIKFKLKLRIHLCFRTGINFHLLTIPASFLHSNIKEIKFFISFFHKRCIFFLQKIHFLLITIILKFLNYIVWSMPLEYYFFVSSKYKKTETSTTFHCSLN